MRAAASALLTRARAQGDGTGPDIWRATKHVLDSAVNKAYGGSRKIEWLEVLAGEKAFNKTGQWLPAETLVRPAGADCARASADRLPFRCQDTFRKQLVGIKGPLTTPVGGGIRSLNVALRQVSARRAAQPLRQPSQAPCRSWTCTSACAPCAGSPVRRVRGAARVLR